MSKEIWKPLLGCESEYEVSDLGNVRSIPRAIDCNGSIWNHPGAILTPIINPAGSLMVSRARDGKRTRHSVRVLVLEAFVSTRPRKHIAAHINGDSSDCSLKNLEWRPLTRRRRPKS